MRGNFGFKAKVDNMSEGKFLFELREESGMRGIIMFQERVENEGKYI